MTLPGEGAPQRPDDEVIAADEQRVADAVAEQAVVADILAEGQARLEPWKESIALALNVSTKAVVEYGARANAGTTNEVTVDPEEGVPVVSDADLLLARIAPSTVIVQVEKNEVAKSPSSWWQRYLSYASETPVKYGWTVAERQVKGGGDDASDAGAVAEGDSRLAGLLADIDGPTKATAATSKVEVDALDEEDDAIPYDVNAVVERIVVVNGTKNALLLIKGKRGELDKASETGKYAPTRIASIKLPKADNSDKKKGDKVAKTKEGLEEYVSRNNFADVSVSVLTKEAIEQGTVDLEDPAEMAALVFDGLCDLMERVNASKRDRTGIPAATPQA
jgi:hypothetical protein